MKYFFEARDLDLETQASTNLDFDAHLHDQIEFGYINSGSSILYVDEKSFKMEQGDFFIVFPNQIHKYEKSENIMTYVIIMQSEFVSEFKNIFSSSVPESPIISGNPDAARLMKLFCLNYKNASEYIVRGFMLTIMGILLEGVKLKPVDKYNISTIKNILIYCDAHYTEPISIADVAAALHISRSYIAHIFREKLNTTFSEYITKKRIYFACGILKNGDLNVTETALASGFDTVRTFNRHFIKAMGISPRDYRKKNM